MKSVICFSLCASAAADCSYEKGKGISGGTQVAFPLIAAKYADCCSSCEDNKRCDHVVFKNGVCFQYAKGDKIDDDESTLCTPGAPPAPPPAPAPPGEIHYGKPPCLDDEMYASITDTDGGICAAKCDDQGKCPTDVPSGKAVPDCALTDDDTGDQYCALECDPVHDCPDGAHCALLAVTFGVCVYPNATSNGAKHLKYTGSSKEDPERPHLAQAWTAMSKGDGLPNQVGQESYVWDEDRKIRGHWYKYDGCQKLSIKDHAQKVNRNYYLKCDALDCCYGDFSMKQWDIGMGKKSEVTFVGLEDTTELNDAPVSQAEHWHEEIPLPFTSYKIQYDHFVTRSDGDVISHRINFNATGGVVPPGEILYSDFQVQHDIDAFIQSEFQIPAQCKRNNLIKCEDSKVSQWEATFFRHSHALRSLDQHELSV
jgi:hypothetical protein